MTATEIDLRILTADYADGHEISEKSFTLRRQDAERESGFKDRDFSSEP